MDALPAATTLARSLLALDRARATGTLRVAAPNGQARIAIVQGTPRAVVSNRGDADTLGDHLSRAGALDDAVHRSALRSQPPAGPVGAWLVATGAASRRDVERALTLQLHRRIAVLFRWSEADLRFMRDGAGIGAPHIPHPESAADLVLGVTRGIVAELSCAEVARRLPQGRLALTKLGEALLSEARLTPAETLMLAPLRAQAGADVVLAAAGRSTQAMRSLYTLRLLAAVRSPPVSSAALGMLARKRGQLRRSEDARKLLDLPRRARSADARRALRRLARVLHPDRFDASQCPELRRASAEVMSALVSAEHHMRRR